jgi:hypothetical protein
MTSRKIPVAIPVGDATNQRVPTTARVTSVLGKIFVPIAVIAIYVIIGFVIFRKKPFDMNPESTPTWTILTSGVACIIIISLLIMQSDTNGAHGYMFVIKNTGVVLGAAAIIGSLLYFGIRGSEIQKSGIRIGVYILLALVAVAITVGGGKAAFSKLSNALGKSLVWFKIVKWFSRMWYDMKRFILTQQVGTRSWMKLLLFGELFVMTGILAAPSVKRILVNRGGIVLLGDKPIPLNTERGLMIYNPKTNELAQDGILRDDRTVLMGTASIPAIGDDMFTYNYSISGWFYIEPGTHQTTNILNYSSRPSIIYDPTLSKISVKTVTGDVTSIEFPLQKWNHLVVNYDGGTLDVFMNNKLVVSQKKVLKYEVDDLTLTVGGDTGIRGGVKNILYFHKAIGRQDVSRLYRNSVL